LARKGPFVTEPFFVAVCEVIRLVVCEIIRAASTKGVAQNTRLFGLDYPDDEKYETAENQQIAQYLSQAASRSASVLPNRNNDIPADAANNHAGQPHGRADAHQSASPPPLGGAQHVQFER
jgi:hypothetical protein